MTDHVKEATDLLIRESWGYDPEKMHPEDYQDAYDNVKAVAPYLIQVGYDRGYGEGAGWCVEGCCD